MIPEASTLWLDVLQRLSQRTNPQSFKTWLEPTKASSLTDGQLVIEVPNPFFADWLEEHYLDSINECVEACLGRRVNISFQAADILGSRISRPQPDVQPAAHYSTAETFLQERYTFENFVVGKGNQFAHAAALAVSKAPATAYNPLFIYGGVGLGKTHLSQAIGNMVLHTRADLRVYYTAAEKFMNEMIYAIQNRSTINFKNKYRCLDLLLIDDIHFLADKESLQEEIFHTFNSLYDAGKQIVVTSDRPPREIPTLEERLISRFQWGLVVDIQPPDLETRIAILKAKTISEGVMLPDDVLFHIANNVKSNIRELEGCLIRLLAFASLTGSTVDLETAREILRDILGVQKSRITIERIQKAVADYYDLSEESLRGKRRTASVALPRQIAMYLSRDLTGLPLKEIGAKFGGKDHTTVIHACEKVRKILRTDAGLRKTIEQLTRVIQNV